MKTTSLLPRIHILGNEPIGKLIAHYLVRSNKAHVTLVFHHSQLLEDFHKAKQTITVVDEDRKKQVSVSKVDGELASRAVAYGEDVESVIVAGKAAHAPILLKAVLERMQSNACVLLPHHGEAVLHRLRDAMRGVDFYNGGRPRRGVSFYASIVAHNVRNTSLLTPFHITTAKSRHGRPTIRMGYAFPTSVRSTEGRLPCSKMPLVKALMDCEGLKVELDTCKSLAQAALKRIVVEAIITLVKVIKCVPVASLLDTGADAWRYADELLGEWCSVLSALGASRAVAGAKHKFDFSRMKNLVLDEVKLLTATSATAGAEDSGGDTGHTPANGTQVLPPRQKAQELDLPLLRDIQSGIPGDAEAILEFIKGRRASLPTHLHLPPIPITDAALAHLRNIRRKEELRDIIAGSETANLGDDENANPSTDATGDSWLERRRRMRNLVPLHPHVQAPEDSPDIIKIKVEEEQTRVRRALGLPARHPSMWGASTTTRRAWQQEGDDDDDYDPDDYYYQDTWGANTRSKSPSSSSPSPRPSFSPADDEPELPAFKSRKHGPQTPKKSARWSGPSSRDSTRVGGGGRRRGWDTNGEEQEQEPWVRRLRQDHSGHAAYVERRKKLLRRPTLEHLDLKRFL